MRRFLLSAMLFILTFCGSYRPPAEYSFENMREYSLSSEVVWEKVNLWLTGKNFKSHIKDSVSGRIIISEQSLHKLYQDVMDCGSIEGEGNIYSRKCGIIIEILSYDRKTKVTVRFNFTAHLQYSGFTTGANRRIDCNSKGVFEKELLDFIAE